MDKLVAADKYPLRHNAERAKTLRDERIKWYRAGVLDAFEKGPGAKAGWAAKAPGRRSSTTRAPRPNAGP